MNLQGSENNSSDNTAADGTYSFEFARALPQVDSNQAKFSSGFLRCRPDKWFPGLAAHWLPFWHSLGIEIKIIEIKTFLKANSNLEKGFYGVVDDERVAVCLDADSEQSILTAVSPGADANALEVLSEYLARRFFSSIAMSWSAAENAKVMFRSQIQTHSFNEAGAVKITFSINNNTCNLWLLLGESLVNRFDGLWRRQLGSPQKEDKENLHDAAVELFSIDLLQSELEAQLKPAHFISFAGNKVETVNLLIDGKPHLPAKLCQVNNKIAIQTVSASIAGTYESSSKTRVSVRFPQFKISSANLIEISQISSIFTTDIDSESVVELFVQDTKIAQGRLAYFLGNLGVLIS